MFCFSGCKKELQIPVEEEIRVNTIIASGLPVNAKTINGYLYASIRENGNNFYVLGACTFSDPAKNILRSFEHFNEGFLFNSGDKGNVDVGSVGLNELNIHKQTSSKAVNYHRVEQVQSLSFDTLEWITEGNKTFNGIRITVPRGFPILIKSSALPSTISKSSGLTLNADSLASNFDSLSVSLYSSGPLIRKTVIPGRDISFSVAELNKVSLSSGFYLFVYAYNYSNITIDSKKYVFELANKIQKPVGIMP